MPSSNAPSSSVSGANDLSFTQGELLLMQAAGLLVLVTGTLVGVRYKHEVLGFLLALPAAGLATGVVGVGLMASSAHRRLDEHGVPAAAGGRL